MRAPLLALTLSVVACATTPIPPASPRPPSALPERAVVGICVGNPGEAPIIGSGFIASSSGVVITATHVITDDHGALASPLYAVRVTDGRLESFPLALVRMQDWTTEGRDIAVLRITGPAAGGPFAHLNIAAAPRQGDSVVILGFPLFLDHVYPWPLLRKGVVASTSFRAAKNEPVYILDITPVQGFSGSPVISAGNTVQVVAVVKGLSTLHPESNFTFAVPVYPSDVPSGP